MPTDCTCGLGDAEFHLKGCALASHLPFEGWARGGMTHFENCWQGHLTCALLYATDLLETALLDMKVRFGDNHGANEEEQAFITHIRDNQ